jgi:hypothetical protein
MAEKCTICVVGPKSAGKSSLLQTFVDCVGLGGHGYSERHNVRIQSIAKDEFAEKGGVSRMFGGQSGDYRIYRKPFFTKQEQTENTIEFFFRISIDTGSNNSILTRVVDSAGEDAVPATYGMVERQEVRESIDKLKAELSLADAAIIVVELVDLGSATFQGPLKSLISELVAEGDNPKRIVVAFTQFERLFVNAGRDAFAIACQPAVARNVIVEALDQSTWKGDLRSFSKLPGRSVHFTVVSSFGFAKESGIPNFDPHWTEGLEMQLLGKPNNIITYWRPFLTADPFVCAATGEPSKYTFTFETLYPEERESAARPSANGPRPGPSTFKTPDPAAPPEIPTGALSRDVLNWFNRRRNDEGDS